MLDNIELIKPLLTFDSADDFYYLQILQRKKENDKTGSNSRIIKNYYISSLEYLDYKYDEIKDLCNLFNARAYLRLNKRSYRKVAFKAMVNLSNTIMNGEFVACVRCYDKAVGQSSNEKLDKRWIVDIDEKISHEKLDELIYIINQYCGPDNISKVKCIIPSKNGIHIISNPFNIQEFHHLNNIDVEIHKDNPTNLFIP